MEKTERLSKMPLIRFTGFTLIPVFIIYALPNIWWGLILKAILVFWLIVTIIASHSPMWSKYETLGAFVTWNTLLFAVLLWLGEPNWLRFILSFLLVLSFATQFHQIDKANKK